MTEQAEYILSRVQGTQRYAVDVGANDGVLLSNTLALEQADWSVLCIEANPLYGPELWACRENAVIGAVSNFEGEAIFNGYETAHGWAAYSGLKDHGRPPTFTVRVPVHTLNWYLEKARFPSLDALCIDIEGNEPEALEGIDLERWQPTVIVVENWDKDGKLSPYLEKWYQKVGMVDYDEIWLRHAGLHVRAR